MWVLGLELGSSAIAEWPLVYILTVFCLFVLFLIIVLQLNPGLAPHMLGSHSAPKPHASLSGFETVSGLCCQVWPELLGPSIHMLQSSEC